MQPNYRYILEKIAGVPGNGQKVVLDYGCGKGDIVLAARERGIQAWGVEKFYGGSNIRETVERDGLLGDAVRELREDGVIPFDDHKFDIVVSNQVFEHVPDLASAVSEIARVLKPGGLLLGLYPSKGTLREVHCGIPVVHWLPKGSPLRYHWLLVCRSAGFGDHKAGKSRKEWARDFDQWLNDFTHYRTRRRVRDILSAHFDTPRPMEEDYMAFRLRLSGMPGWAEIASRPVFRWAFRSLCRLYGGSVFLAQKH